MKTQSTTRRYVRNSVVLGVLFALSIATATNIQAQANHNVTRSNKTQPVAGSGPDSDCDGVCGEVRGSVQREGRSLTIVVDQQGGSGLRIPLSDEETDLDTLAHPTPIYMSINDGGVQLADGYGDGSGTSLGGTSADSRGRDYNSSRSNNTSRAAAAGGSLEHTDARIAARAASADSFFDITFLHIPTDVHSGKLTGVRQHAPFKVGTAYDAATPFIYKATVATEGTFSVLLPATPGVYRIVVTDGGGVQHRGHVTVLK